MIIDFRIGIVLFYLIVHSSSFQLNGIPSFKVFPSSLYGRKSAAPIHKAHNNELPSKKIPRRYYETYIWKGFRINYRSAGPTDGQPILLIHGFGACVDHWRKNLPVYAENGFRTYAIDLLGFGGSEKPKNVSYSLELWEELVIDFMNHFSLPSEKWVIMGNSIGGLITLMTTKKLQDSQRVRGSVVFNCPGALVSFREEEIPWQFRGFWWLFQNFILSDDFGPIFFNNFKTRENVERTLRQVYVDKNEVSDELVNMLLAPSEDEGACNVFLKVLKAPPGPTPESLLVSIKSKILLIWGDKDPWTPLYTGYHPGIKFGDYCKSLELLVLKNTGHCPHDEKPKECNDAVLRFMNDLQKMST